MSVEHAVPEEAARETPGLEELAATDQTTRLEPSPAADEAIQLPAGGLAYDVVGKLRELPYEKQREVMDFVQFLLSRMPPKRPRRSLEGMLAHLDIHISSEEIAEARREMWGNFPRELPDE